MPQTRSSKAILPPKPPPRCKKKQKRKSRRRKKSNFPALEAVEGEWRRQLAYTKKFHVFVFFNLPTLVRWKIYHYIFLNSEIQVCSFNKDHTATTFPRDERCQILLTCKRCRKEAMPIMYRTATFQFNKRSSFDYFIWNGGNLNKLQYINRIVLNQVQLVPVFIDFARLFPRLSRLVIDVPLRIQRNARFTNQDHTAIASAIRRSAWVNDHIIIFIHNRCRFNIELVVQYEFILADETVEYEICVVNLDLLTIVRNYRPYTAVQPEVASVMPSSFDEDALNREDTIH